MADDNGKILDAIEKFFESQKWQFQKNTEQNVLRMSFNGKNGRWLFFAQGLEEQRRAVFYSVYETPVPEPRRVAVAELITRLNFGLALGNFELDFSSGSLRYKTSVDVPDTPLTDQAVRTLTMVNCMMLDQCIPALKDVIDEKQTAEAAAEAVRSAPPQEGDQPASEG